MHCFITTCLVERYWYVLIKQYITNLTKRRIVAALGFIVVCYRDARNTRAD